jgi:hypothetical protein
MSRRHRSCFAPKRHAADALLPVLRFVMILRHMQTDITDISFEHPVQKSKISV